MIDNVLRNGNFTSSKAGKLTANGTGPYKFSAGAITYIRGKRAERRVKRSSDLGAVARPMSWGKLMEKILFHELGGEYSLVSKETVVHPKYKYWAGSPDMIKNDKVTVEAKSYYIIEHDYFCENLLSKDIEKIKKNCHDEYWQVVSNACILGHKRAELIAFMPTKAQLIEIARLLNETDFLKTEMPGEDPYNYIWIYNAVNEGRINTLPYIPEDSDCPSEAKFEFEIPADDIVFITQRMANAEKLLNEMAV